MGTLYLVSTPIGNLEDISDRAKRILGEVGAVLAEDTRRTRALLSHLGLSKPLVSLHEHNEKERSAEVLGRLAAGDSLALVSDAGTPLVSDPGERIVRLAIEGGHEVVPIPGPSAVLHALVGSGLLTIPFTFLGFVPRKGPERNALLAVVAGSQATVVLFEAPGRVAGFLRDLARACGPDRPAAVARELTKVHEEFRRGTLGDLAEHYAEVPPRGEVTVVIGPAAPTEPEACPPATARLVAEALLGRGMAPGPAARELARTLGIPRNIAYDFVVQARGASSSSDTE